MKYYWKLIKLKKISTFYKNFGLDQSLLTWFFYLLFPFFEPKLGSLEIELCFYKIGTFLNWQKSRIFLNYLKPIK